MADVVVTALSFALGLLVPWSVVRWDLRRLEPSRLERAWNDASMWSAVLAFGPLAVWVHFAKTRASVWGVLLGLLAALGATSVIAGVTYAVGRLLGLK